MKQKDIDVKKLREKLRMNPAELAVEMGVAERTVNRWEKGETKPSRMAQKLLAEIAKERKAKC